MWSCGGGCAVVEATAGVARIYSRSGAAGSRKRDTTTRVAGATRPPITGVQSLSRLLTARKVSSSFVYTCFDSGKQTSGNETLWCSADGNCWFVMQLACVFAAIYWLTLCKFFSGAWDIVCFHELFFCGVGRVWSPARTVSSVLWLTKGHTGQQRPFTCKFSWSSVSFSVLLSLCSVVYHRPITVWPCLHFNQESVSHYLSQTVLVCWSSAQSETALLHNMNNNNNSTAFEISYFALRGSKNFTEKMFKQSHDEY